jgi:uncharacterized protein YjbI with pentapeptide repeats
MANQEHLDILRQGIVAWNAWRKANPDIRPDLNGADLIEADLSGAHLYETGLHGANLHGANLNRADLSGADLNRADLSGAGLSRADLSEADLSEADLHGVDLSRAYLTGADLSRADLIEADLSGTDLIGANLHEADLSEADLIGAHLNGADLGEANLEQTTIGFTTFADTDLSAVRGLDTVRHLSPSTIGIDTLYASQGNIPEAFLRDCGVPDSFIEYIPYLIGAMQPVQFYSCFISYSTKDEDFARRLHERMRAEHLRVWFAPEDIQGGKKIHEQIDQAIRVYDKLVLILSEHSIASEWVQQELRRARRAELESQQRKLFPIRLIHYNALQSWECIDSRSGSDLAEEVRQYFIPDFTHWKEHDAFEREFARLLRDLKATEAPPAP